MFLRLLYDEKLAHSSYLIGCQASGEAIVVDPNRDSDRYIALARKEGLRVAHVTETHIHADFVSGARELAHRTGARLYLSAMGGADWQYRFADAAGAELLKDGSSIRMGGVELSVLHTPGHTPEHLAFLVTDTKAGPDPMGALTGDFLFVGDVGRPDLLERAAKQHGTMVASAHQLFASLRRLRTLPDYLQVWPAHGAGSACGKSLGAVPQSTLGYEKRTNWAFAVEDEEEFVRLILEGQPEPPRYFAFMKQINRDGPPLVAGKRRPERRPVDRLAPALAAGATVVDTRPAQEYAGGAMPGTINIPANRAFTTWAGWLLPYDRDIYLITEGNDPTAAEGMARDLSGIGLDRVAGYFVAGELKETPDDGRFQRVPTVDGATVERSASGGEVTLVDVRAASEWREGHIPSARHLFLGEFPDRIEELPRDRPIVVHCQNGGRAAIAASFLLAHGFADVAVFPGGLVEWKASGRAVVRD